MASRLEYVQYVAEQLSGAGEITYKKMFGEYGLYCDGKIFANVSDDQLFVKITEVGRACSRACRKPRPIRGRRIISSSRTWTTGTSLPP